MGVFERILELLAGRGWAVLNLPVQKEGSVRLTIYYRIVCPNPKCNYRTIELRSEPIPLFEKGVKTGLPVPGLGCPCCHERVKVERVEYEDIPPKERWWEWPKGAWLEGEEREAKER